MSPIDAIVEELKVLPPERLEALRATDGALTAAEAGEWAKGRRFERIDESGW